MLFRSLSNREHELEAQEDQMRARLKKILDTSAKQKDELADLKKELRGMQDRHQKSRLFKLMIIFGCMGLILACLVLSCSKLLFVFFIYTINNLVRLLFCDWKFTGSSCENSLFTKSKRNIAYNKRLSLTLAKQVQVVETTSLQKVGEMLRTTNDSPQFLQSREP